MENRVYLGWELFIWEGEIDGVVEGVGMDFDMGGICF